MPIHAVDPTLNRELPNPTVGAPSRGPLAVMLALLIAMLFSTVASAQTTIPALSPAFGDDFDRDTLEDWGIAPGSNLGLVSGLGPDGSVGLSVTVSAAESHLVIGGARAVARADEAYLSFWFNPNSVSYTDPGSGFLPDRSIQIAAIKASSFKNMVAIRFRQVGGGYEAYLEWRDGADTAQFDHDTGSFAITNGWQRITIGFRANDWVAAWIGGTNVRSVTGIDHLEDQASVIEVGKTLANSAISPSGTLRFDDPQLEVPTYSDLWVDAVSGDDANNGQTPGTAFATIARAADLAAAGTTVRILPGVYRDPVVPAQGGTATDAVVYKAENGRGTAILRGSVSSGDLSWNQLGSNTIGLPPSVSPSNVWWTDLSSWGLDVAPRFVVRMNGDEVDERLPVAREPDWTVQTDYKPSEFWWAATGGDAEAGCDPTGTLDAFCDFASQSRTQLTDTANDAIPAGVEAGNLTTLGNLTGGQIFALDTARGHYHYRRTIIAHNVAAGRVTVDADCVREGDPGLGWGSKYYVEDLPILLDTPGEWWFDPSTDRLYLWPTVAGNPSAQPLEISRFENGFDLKDRSYVTIEDMAVELWNGEAIENRNFINHRSIGNRVVGSLLHWVNRGIEVFHQVQAGNHTNKRIQGFVIANNEIAQADTHAIKVSHIWDGGSDADLWERHGVLDTVIRDNLVYDIGFRVDTLEDSTGAINVRFPQGLRMLRNNIRDTATEGTLILEGVVQSPDTFGHAPSELAIHDVLVQDNVITRACTMKSDCGGIRIWGQAPDNHVFRDFLVIGNTFRDVVGWGWPNQQRGINSSGQIAGAGGSGLYYDQTSGIHTYRNVMYNNGLAGIFFISTWRDGPHTIVGNVASDNLMGLRFGGLNQDSHGSVDTRVLNNVLINNEGFGVNLADADGAFPNTTFDRNLYFFNGWGSSLFMPGAFNLVEPAGQTPWPTLSAIRTNSPFEDDGQAANPSFVEYDPADHDPFDQSRPDFQLRVGSAAINAGTTVLPASLDSVLAHFGIPDDRLGARYDQGAFEGGIVVPDEPIFSDGFESGNTSAWSQTIGD